jgi:allantoicase
MSDIIRAPGAPEVDAFQGMLTNLADQRFGAEVVAVSDEWFAPASRLLNPLPPELHEGRFDDHGGWMDGWETRRRRKPGFDWAIIRLPRMAVASRVDLDTTFFTGNYAPAMSIEACVSDAALPPESANWMSLLDETELSADSHHCHCLNQLEAPITHVRIQIVPDGGLARLRLFGRFVPAPNADRAIDLAATLNGGVLVVCNDAEWGDPRLILMPGRGVDMGDGWETRRRREPGFDWAIVELGAPGRIERLEIDTAHFKGNYPDKCSVHAAFTHQRSLVSLTSMSIYWQELLAPNAMRSDDEHVFTELTNIGVVSHLRINLHPDGGISRLRAFGVSSGT